VVDKIVNFFVSYPILTWIFIFLLTGEVGLFLLVMLRKDVQVWKLKVSGGGGRKTVENAFQHVQAVPRVGSSPVRLDNALKAANQCIYLGGQNMYWMVTQDDLPRQISSFLAASKDREFGVLLCDPSNSECVNAWSTINPSDPNSDYTYDSHLKEAFAFIEKIKKQVSAQGGAFSAKKVPLFPFEIMFVDPTEADGYLSFQPIINYSHDGAERPQFIISKKENEEIFSHYWEKFRLLFRTANDA
jgi:hypothetical protein